MPDLKTLLSFFAHWGVMLATLAAYAVWRCGFDAVRHGALPQNDALLGEGGVLLYTVLVTAFYTVGLARLGRKFTATMTPRQHKWLYAGWLFDMSLFWLFGAYCLLRNYANAALPFFASWSLWTMLGVYVLLLGLMHVLIGGPNRGGHTAHD